MGLDDYEGFDTRVDWPTPELAAVLALLPVGRALDLGCGHGTEALQLAAAGWTVVGVDRQPTALAEARRRRENLGISPSRLELKRGSALRFREPRPGGFSLVLDRLLLINLRAAERPALLRTAAHALAPGGVFLLRWHFLPDGHERGDWGARRWEESSLTRTERRLAERWFHPARELPFTGLASPWQATSDGSILHPTPLKMSLFALARTEAPAPRR
ncbi:MAG TPA: class I SAM-dependent methyltransferase [Myxococcaceae bacterium]|nr:class I SAM-dependent methyltransferase [Myxococcaceae bacterium]